LKKGCLLLISLGIIVFLEGCSKNPLNSLANQKCLPGSFCAKAKARELRDFIQSIPKLNENPLPSQDTVILGSRTILPGIRNGEPIYEMRESHEMLQTFEELVAFDPNSDVMWPGALIQGRTLQSGFLSPIPLPRASAEITLTNISLPAGLKSYVMVEDPTLGRVNQAIQDILNQSSEITSAAEGSYTMKEFHSLEQGFTQVGISANWLGGAVKAALSDASYRNKRNFIVKFTQKYYSASFEPPKTAEAVFHSNVKIDEARLYMSTKNSEPDNSNPPVYLSSVDYGRMMIFIFSSEVEASLMELAIKAIFESAKNGVEIQLSAEQEKMIQSFETKALVLGGSAKSMVHLITGNKIKAISDWIIQGANVSQKSPGVPISFKARFLKDHDLAKVTFATKYEISQMRPIPMVRFDLTAHTLDDDKDIEEPLDIWLMKEGQVLYQGTVGENEVWKDHSDKQFLLPLPENIELGLNACQGMQIRIRKRPWGSATGCGWSSSFDLKVRLEDGREFNALSSAESSGRRWGDGHEYDRTFNLKCK